MNFEMSRQILVTTTGGSSHQLIRPLIASNFVAGQSLSDLRWLIIPKQNLLSIAAQRSKSPGLPTAVISETRLEQHLESLFGQELSLQLPNGSFVKARAIESQADLLVVESETIGRVAFHACQLLELSLWKTSPS
jgi:hypothetical protein